MKINSVLFPAIKLDVSNESFYDNRDDSAVISAISEWTINLLICQPNKKCNFVKFDGTD